MNLAFSNYKEYLLSADGYASSLKALEGVFRKKYKAAFPEDNKDVLDDAKSDSLESDDCLYEELAIRQELKMKEIENRSLIKDNLPQSHSLLNDNGETGKATAGGRHVIDDQVPGPSSQMYLTKSSSAEAGAVDLEECRGMAMAVTPPPLNVASLKMEFGTKPMTYDEKARLLAEIYQLQDKVGMLKIIGIIKYHEPTVEVNDNLEVDLESLQPSTLRDLEVTIAATLKRKLPKLSCEKQMQSRYLIHP
jgi:hypothetical protein